MRKDFFAGNVGGQGEDFVEEGKLLETNVKNFIKRNRVSC